MHISFCSSVTVRLPSPGSTVKNVAAALCHGGLLRARDREILQRFTHFLRAPRLLSAELETPNCLTATRDSYWDRQIREEFLLLNSEFFESYLITFRIPHFLTFPASPTLCLWRWTPSKLLCCQALSGKNRDCITVSAPDYRPRSGLSFSSRENADTRFIKTRIIVTERMGTSFCRFLHADGGRIVANNYRRLCRPLTCNQSRSVSIEFLFRFFGNLNLVLSTPVCEAAGGSLAKYLVACKYFFSLFLSKLLAYFFRLRGGFFLVRFSLSGFIGIWSDF